MSTILGSLLRVDLSKVSAEVIEGLQTGKMILSSSNGNVYWATGSGSSGMVTQLPLIPVSPEELASAEQLLQVGKAVSSAKAAALTATAAGTAVVVIAVVIATTYLAKKIEKVERSVKAVAQTVVQQDQREYLGRVSEYMGAIMDARQLLESRVPIGEIASQAELKIDRLSNLRQELLLFVAGIPQIISSAQTTESQYTQGVRFAIEMLDLLPSAMAVERELCMVANKTALAQSLRDQAATQFRKQLADFRVWCELQYRNLALGHGRFAEFLVAEQSALYLLFNSPVHDMLMGGFASFGTQPKSAVVEPESAGHGLAGSDAAVRAG
jgi:hypothetical protein